MKVTMIRSLTQLSSVVTAATLLLFTNPFATRADDSGTGVAPPGSHPFGNTYNQWAGRWWKWFMELPLTNAVGAVHPAIDAGQSAFDVREGQIGQVWFLAAPFGTVSRSATVPEGKALFFGLLNAEWSSLEGPTPYCSNNSDASCQSLTASNLVNYIENLHCEIDGQAVNNLSAFRFPNAQIKFTAPTPWIFGPTGGPATSSGDGYYIFLNPLESGVHTIHFSGDFAPPIGPASLDMTYKVRVQEMDQNDDNDDD
jgi:hypothetical protein